jgi:hypothetical protein
MERRRRYRVLLRVVRDELLLSLSSVRFGLRLHFNKALVV